MIDRQPFAAQPAATFDRAQLEELLAAFVRAGGTALHLMPDRVPWIRLDGRVMPLSERAIEAHELHDLLRDFLFADHHARLAKGEEVDVLFATKAGDRFRTMVIPQADGENVVFRRVPDQVPSFEEAGLPELLAALLAARDGLVVLTGSDGSGKRATLAAMVARLAQERAVQVVTIERQIEFVHTNQRSIVQQREVGTHVDSVADGVREALLQSADVIVIDELDDAAGLRAAIAAAESGRLVIASFDASCVVGAVARLPGLAPGEERSLLRRRLAGVLRALISQTLVRRRHGRGRVPLLEILLRNDAVCRAIRRGRHDELPGLMARGRGLGMQTSDMALRALVQRNLVSADEARWHAHDRDQVLGPR